MKKFSDIYLCKKRNALIKELQLLEPHTIRGSFAESYKSCGKSGCKCVTGPGHGPKYYLVAGYPAKKQKTAYLPSHYQSKIKKYLKNRNYSAHIWRFFATTITRQCETIRAIVTTFAMPLA